MSVEQVIAWKASDGSIHATQTFAELHDIQEAKESFSNIINNSIDWQNETIDYDYIIENILVLLRHAMRFSTEQIIPLDDYYKCINMIIDRSNEDNHQ